MKERYILLMIDIIKAIILGVVEGITEWLPVSSTGHLILVQSIFPMNVSQQFNEMFDVVIQLGAIIAVVVLFWNSLWPFCNNKNGTNLIEKHCKKDVWVMWSKVLVAILPVMVMGLLFDDFMTENFHNPLVVALMLILYGIIFIIVEKIYKGKKFKVNSIAQISYQMALGIGLFQVLSLVPGTSRSGATIIGALILGASRQTAAQFTFYLAVPVMFGASLLKVLNFGFIFTGMEIAILVSGMISAFVVSMIAIRFLMDYVKRHDFKVFGYYRIIVGAIVLIYFYIIN